MPPTPPPSPDNLVTPVGTTLERYIMRKQAEFPFATGELSQLLRDLALASKIMAREVSRAGLSSLAEAVGPEGEHQAPRHRLGEEAHIRFVRALTNGRECCAVLSEASPDIIDTGHHDGRYVVALNPLNGSVSLDFNVSTGTIFSIYRRVSRYGGPARAEDFLQGGRRWQRATSSTAPARCSCTRPGTAWRASPTSLAWASSSSRMPGSLFRLRARYSPATKAIGLISRSLPAPFSPPARSAATRPAT